MKAQSITIGSRVEMIVNGIPQTWEVVLSGKVDIENKKVSADAPLIQFILGAKEGDTIKQRIRDRSFIIEIVKIY
ncbi:MAG: GreA/GreB family elongation factor [Patescibacteria group bacterium]